MALRASVRAFTRPMMMTRPVMSSVATTTTTMSTINTTTTRALTTTTARARRTNTSSTTSTAWFAAGGLVATSLLLINAKAAEEKKPAPAATAAAPGKVDYEAVRKAIADSLDDEKYIDGISDGSRGPVYVRLAWHAAGTFDKASRTGGSDGATMRFPEESKHGANAGLLMARDFLEPIKKQFPNISYADLWTLAGGVAIEEMGGPKILWRPGRADAAGPTSPVPDGRLPDAAQGQQHIRDIFYRMGFNDQEIVALLGAHAIGGAHPDRSGFNGPWTRAPTTFSNEFFRVLLEEKWSENKDYLKARQWKNAAGDLMMLPTDIALTVDPEFRKHVEIYAKDEQLFFRDFANAWNKLMELGVRNLAPASPFSGR